MVDQLRIENAALRAALNQAQMLNGSANTNGADISANGTTSEQPATVDTSEKSTGGENKDGNVS